MDTKGIKRPIVRKRRPKACVRCYSIKRKCDHSKPSCSRCKRKKVKCEYFSDEQVMQRCLQRRDRLTGDDSRSLNSYLDDSVSDNENIPNTELNPTPRESEARNFKLIVNSTGEYSKYLSLSLFPFSDPSQNVSYIVDRLPRDRDKYLVFDFSTVANKLNGIDEIRKHIPKRKHCDMLVKYFFENISAFIPIIDKEEFELKYDEYWQSFNSPDELNTLIVLFAVLFSSCVSIQLTKIYFTGIHYAPTDPIDYEKLKYSSYTCVENIKNMTNMNVAPSMSSLTALTLMYYVGSLNCYGTSGEVSALLRFCQITGLHRSLTQVDNDTSLRDFLYSYVLYLDTLVAYYNGLPSNIHKDIFETVRNFPKRTKDLKTLHSLGKLHSCIVWADLLYELNKIEKSNEEQYSRLYDEYLESQQKVNSLNAEILNDFPDISNDYLELLVSEGRLGLRKSAILVHFLKISLANINRKSKAEGERHNHSLVIQALLLINESLMKIVLGVKHNTNLLWFVRNSYPFQAMSIVLTHIQKSPEKAVNFKDLSPEIEFTRHPDIDYEKSDVRKELVNKAMDALLTIKPLWPTVFQKRFDKICELQKYVLGETLELNKTQPPQLHDNSQIDSDLLFDELLNSLFEEDSNIHSLFFQNLNSPLCTKNL